MRTAERLVALLLGEAEEAPMIAMAFAYEPDERKPRELIFRNERDLTKLKQLVPKGYNFVLYRYDTGKYEVLAKDRREFLDLVHSTLGLDRMKERIAQVQQDVKERATHLQRAERIKPQGPQPKTGPEPEARHVRPRPDFRAPPGFYLKNKRVPTQVVRPQGKPSPQPSNVRRGEVRYQAPGYRFDRPWPQRKSPVKIDRNRYKPWMNW